MRWHCTACDVEWTASGRDHGPCFNCERTDFVEPAFDVPFWAWGYRP